MSETRGVDWDQVVDSLHGLSNVMTVRSHYPAGHPAIERAGRVAAESLGRALAKTPEVVVALLDGELVVCERPMPEMRQRLAALTEAMARHELECFVVQRGVTPAECTTLGRFLASPVDADLHHTRDQTQAELAHVLLRYAVLRAGDDARNALAPAEYFVETVRSVQGEVARSLASRTPLARATVDDVAGHLISACRSHTYRIEQRSIADKDDLAAHSTNVALMTAAMALEAGHDDDVCVDITSAALVHDIGQLLLPIELRGVPEPLLDEAKRTVFRNHTFAGARALLVVGCPSLWVTVALEHHRGIDGRGYPALQSTDAPHPLVRLVTLANYFERKRTMLAGKVDDPERVVESAMALEGRYFDGPTLRSFMRALGTFWPGTTVELSDRRAAIVTHTNTTDPVRPYVELLTGTDAGKRFDLKTLDGNEDRHVLSIVRAIAPPILLRAAPQDELIPVLEPIAEPILIDERMSAPPPLVTTKPRLSGLYTSVPRVDDPAADEPPIPSAPPPPVSLPPRIVSSRPPSATSEEDALARLGSLDRVPVLAVAPGELAKLSIDHRAGFLLTMIDGVTPLDMIVDASGLPRADVLEIVVTLLDRGVIRFQ